jgi:hypothetical protein
MHIKEMIVPNTKEVAARKLDQQIVDVQKIILDNLPVSSSAAPYTVLRLIKYFNEQSVADLENTLKGRQDE